MCGILSVICEYQPKDLDKILESTQIISQRGPDRTTQIVRDDLICLFSRLAINDRSKKGDQPFKNEDGTQLLMCNGQIYNHVELKERFGLKCESGSDCEVILKLYQKLGFEETIKQLDGVFAIVLIDKNLVHFARDRIGVRPLYIGYTQESFLALASVPQALTSFCRDIHPVSPGAIETYDRNTKLITSSGKLDFSLHYIAEPTIGSRLRTTLEKSVQKRLIGDRPIGCLLSGGLDSSIVCALLCKYLKPENVRTYSIGFEGSTDLHWAKRVSSYLGTKHTEVIVNESQALSHIPEVIRTLASYDITTVRASTMMYILCQYIKETTDDKIIFSGEGSDELLAGYLYFHKAPTHDDITQETSRLVQNLHLYDVLRADRCISMNGLEARVPFLDKEMVELCLSIHGKHRHPQTHGIEKGILRKAFADLLPNDVLYRAKVAFSNGCSQVKKDWAVVIQQYVEDKVSEVGDFPSKEARYYYNVFKEFYPNYDPKIEYWLPKFVGDVKDPSARVLEVCQEQDV